MFGKKKLVGLDIGSSAIKIAEVDLSRKGAKLQTFGLVPTPHDSMANSEIIEPNRIAEAVQNLLQEIKSSRKNVSTGLWGSSVIVKKISIPKMEEKLIGEQIRWEAEQYIPYDINEVSLDFEVLKTNSEDVETMDILLIAAVQDQIFKSAEVVSLAGLNCSVLDVEGFALANCFEVNYGKVPGTVGLLNIGSMVTNFVVVENGEIIFCRDIPIGGVAYTTDLAKGLTMSMQEAEAIKLGMGHGQIGPEQAAPIIQSTHDVLCEEINNSVDFFNNTGGGESLERLYVTGGGSKVEGALEAISRILPAEKLNPFMRVDINKRVFSDEYINQIIDYSAIAIGLGLREVDK